MAKEIENQCTVNLYHYCPPSAFFEIIRDRTIRLSSLSFSNDSMEGRLVSQTLLKFAKQDVLRPFAMERLKDKLRMLEDVLDGFGFCLSENGDQLSQWRSYASDASGFSIGFSKQHLEAWSARQEGFNLSKVVYSASELEELLGPIYTRIRKLVEKDEKKYGGLAAYTRNENKVQGDDEDVKTAVVQLIHVFCDALPALYLMKNQGFSEENEWRLIGHASRHDDIDCSFQMVNGRIVPYRECSFPEDLVEEVYLGPKNRTPNYVVQRYLRKCGINNARILKSKATYQ